MTAPIDLNALRRNVASSPLLSIADTPRILALCDEVERLRRVAEAAAAVYEGEQPMSHLGRALEAE